MANIQEDVQKALNRAYFFLKFRPRTKKEVRDYLLKKSEKYYHWSSEVIDQALLRLEQLDFINDEKFIDSYVHSRNALKPKGEFALRKELIGLGVEKSFIDNYFADNPLDEETSAFQVLKSRWLRYRHLDKKTRFEKAVQFLMRRGFTFSIAKKVTEELENK